MQRGTIFRKGPSWFLKYRDSRLVNGQIVRTQRCVRLAEYSDRYLRKSDLANLVAERLTDVRAAANCPRSSDFFITYVEQEYLPYVKRSKKPSTCAGYRTHWNLYIKPKVGRYALRDFTVAIVSGLLEDAAATHKLNTATLGKVRSILSAIFTYAMGKGHFPGKTASDNPASGALIPESATKPERTVAASRSEVQAALMALRGMPLERAAVAILAYTGVRPGEARGLRWEEWNRMEQHIAVTRAVWHTSVGTPKNTQSERFIAVTDELREVLLDLWKAQGSPIAGYILAGERRGAPVNLDNLLKRRIRPALEKADVPWRGWYALRRFHGTEVRMQSGSSETAAKALGNSKEVADAHYIKPQTVLPDVRQAVNGIRLVH